MTEPIVPEVGKVYIKQTSSNPTIRKVTKIEDGIVYYQYLHGPRKRRVNVGQCKMRTFCGWATNEIKEETVETEYKKYCGAKIQEPHLMLGLDGNPLFKCSPKKAQYYLKKNLAISIDEKTHQLTTPSVEQRFEQLYGDKLSPFFLETKNDKCVVCGINYNLTRHHIVPKRHKPHLLIESKMMLSNVLFVCHKCHHEYEKHQPKENEIDIHDPYAWKDHFIKITKPKFLPNGWDIVLIKGK